MRERTFTGYVNGTKFRYSVIMAPFLPNSPHDPEFEKYEDDQAQRRFADAFVRDMVKRGEITITTEEYEW